MAANFALRLIQVHMCIIYFFAGISKLQGAPWWNGEAMWLAFGNLEYQSADMTWLAWHPWVVQLPDPFHGVLGDLVLRAHLGSPVAAARARFVGRHAPGDRCVPGPVDVFAVMLIGCASFLPPDGVGRLVAALAGLPARRKGQPATELNSLVAKGINAMRLKPAFLLAALAVGAPAADAAGPNQPNIVFILADDLGHGDLGCYGQTKIKTPNLDRMAAEGMRFTNFYAAAASVRRAAARLMTGKHLGHATVRDNMQRSAGPRRPAPHGAGHGHRRAALEEGRLRHGHRRQVGPRDAGGSQQPARFRLRPPLRLSLPGDGAHVLPALPLARRPAGAAGGQSAYFYGQKEPIAPSGKIYAHDLMADDALRWVREHKDEPFFLYLAFTIPHVSLQVPDDSLAEYRGQWPETPLTTRNITPIKTPRAPLTPR